MEAKGKLFGQLKRIASPLSLASKSAEYIRRIRLQLFDIIIIPLSFIGEFAYLVGVPDSSSGQHAAQRRMLVSSGPAEFKSRPGE